MAKLDTYFPPIHIFPDTGHHYTFVPMGIEDIDRQEQIFAHLPELRECRIDDASLLKACAADVYPGPQGADTSNSWKEFPGTRWIRYRWGSRTVLMEESSKLGEVKFFGVWLAIESNVGDFGRGYQFMSTVPTTQEKEQFDPKIRQQQELLYASAHTTNLKDLKLPPLMVQEKNEAGKLVSVKIGNGEWDSVFKWQEIGGEPVDVDLVIDFGNTRTVVLALEHFQAHAGQLSAICRPIRFPGRSTDEISATVVGHDDLGFIVESWIVLQEPMFGAAEFTPPDFKITRQNTEVQTVKKMFGTKEVEVLTSISHSMPQMFVELSPVIIGPLAGRILAKGEPQSAGMNFLSSPKRYFWDTDPMGHAGSQYWTMALNGWNPNRRKHTEIPKLKGEMLRFLPKNGADWKVGNPPTSWAPVDRPAPDPDQPSYPRSDAMTWTALSILEAAYRQIHSYAWRRRHSSTLPRQLRNVLVTFPSGWTQVELDVYKAKWQKAIDIFTLTHFEESKTVQKGGKAPVLNMDLDEAVASQLPIVYSGIRDLGNRGNNWLQLYGRGTPGKCRVRVMTIDIGGGTTDISIVEYSNRHPEINAVDLRAELLFRDSSTVAGDRLVKEIVESVLLPRLAPSTEDEKMKREFTTAFSASAEDHVAKEEMLRISRLVFIPIVQQWLKHLRSENTDEGGQECSARSAGAHEDGIALFNSKFTSEFLNFDNPLPLEATKINLCVRAVFSSMFASLAKYVTAFQCDLVVVTGKPSEIPEVNLLLRERLPVLSSRLIFAKDYPAGNWYPMSRSGSISDAKTVTAVGAALFQAIKNGNINGWKLERSTSKHMLVQNWWGSMPEDPGHSEFGDVYLTPAEAEKEVKIQVNTYIGRKLLESASAPEQVYQFRWKDAGHRAGKAAFPANQTLKVKLRRVLDATKAEKGEQLQLVSVVGEWNGRQFGIQDVELKLNSLAGGEFWMDTARFEVRWPETAASQD